MNSRQIALLTVGMALGACEDSSSKLAVRPIPNGESAVELGSGDLAVARGELALNNVGLALEAFRKVQLEQPSDPAPWAGIGDCYTAMGRYDLAQSSYETALSLAPHDRQLLLGLAQVFELEGQSDRAAEIRVEVQSASAAPATVSVAAPPQTGSEIVPEALASGVGSVTIDLSSAAPAQRAPSTTATAPAQSHIPVRAAHASAITVALPPARPAPSAPLSAAETPKIAAAASQPMPVQTASGPSITVIVPPARPVEAPRVKVELAVAQAKPRLERVSPGEVSLITSGQPPLSHSLPSRQVASSVRWMPLQPSPSQRVMVVNAARTQGLAASARAVLLQRGWRRLSISTAAAPEQSSFVLYPRGRAALARRLASQFAVRARLWRGNMLVVVLGRDRIGRMRPQRHG